MREASSAGVVIFLGVIFCLVLWIFQTNIDSDRNEADLQRVVRSLTAAQEKNEAILSEIERQDSAIVEHKFPWLPKNYTLPNYFFQTEKQNYFYKYHNAHIAFLDYPLSQGGQIIDCLQEVSKMSRKAMSPLMSSKNRVDWESGRDNLDQFRHRLTLHSGRYVFGVCEKLKDYGAYFLLVQDPMQQAISSYKYCQEMNNDDICHGYDANRMTLRDWIIHQGSVLFNQIVLNVNLCEEDVVLNVTESEFLFEKKDFPCWMKQKLFMDKFSTLDITHVTNYIINHLEKWFAVIGLFDELQDSIQMFEKVYKLPFSKCKHFDKEHTKLHSETGSRDNSVKSFYHRQLDIYEYDPVSLADDLYVKKALEADYRIYRKALKIYHRQKQVTSNQIW